ncbi:c-type cytochrome [Roseomonas populi]|uniref:C-type cytochrome n=1 Tax=Roseomonas populi TaxID=3121582 RepID=A0ABT1XBK7_9PROT|nr:c-type cytochrome [Roseomonas pecuniae]MCR0985521.1 c-type cytochrome [Roseomonas pecuniae]
MRAALAFGCIAALVIGGLYFGAGQRSVERPRLSEGPINLLLADADVRAGARLFRQCAACHTIGRGAPDLNGPNLYGVLGAPIAGNRPNFAYTQALRSAGGEWDAERMDAWLRNPQGLVPGNRMTFTGMPNARERADLIAYLGRQGS